MPTEQIQAGPEPTEMDTDRTAVIVIHATPSARWGGMFDTVGVRRSTDDN